MFIRDKTSRICLNYIGDDSVLIWFGFTTAQRDYVAADVDLIFLDVNF